jgi:Zn-dependent protease
MSLGAFYKKQITVARVYGIPVRIDYRWFIVVGLSVWLIARNLQTDIFNLEDFSFIRLRQPTAWLLGMITTAGLFLSCLATSCPTP